jgi:F0F1-type ATP synthase alpha subunit
MEIKTADTGAFIKAFLDYLKLKYAGLMEAIAQSGDISTENEQDLTRAVEDFRPLWRK